MDNAGEEKRELRTPTLLRAEEELCAIPQGVAGSRILIVEDDEAVLKCVQIYLTQKGYVVTAVSSAHEFYQHIFREPYAVVVLDVGLPDQSGLILAEYVRKNTEMRIIIFSGRDAIDDQLAGHYAGADLYLVKPIDVRQLSAAISGLLSRVAKPTIQPHILTRPQPISSQPQAKWRLISRRWILLSPQGNAIQLTNKELDFLASLVASPNAVVPRFELLTRLGYLNNESGQHSLQSLVNRLRKKIELHNTQSPILTSHGVGYTFLDDITME
jgi:DNA-binding response OmpR family regulator